MSYINVSVTHEYGAGGIVLPRTTTLDAGFGREGGRLEQLTRTTKVAGPFPPRVSQYDVTPELQAASRGVLDAALGAGGLRNVRIEHGDGGQPDLVSWSDRFGAQLGSALAGSEPTAVRAVIDAVAQLEHAMGNGAPGAAPAA